MVTQVFFCSASPAIRYPNVYGIDMPVQSELIAFGRNETQIAEAISADWVVYQVGREGSLAHELARHGGSRPLPVGGGVLREGLDAWWGLGSRRTSRTYKERCRSATPPSPASTPRASTVRACPGNDGPLLPAPDPVAHAWVGGWCVYACRHLRDW